MGKRLPYTVTTVATPAHWPACFCFPLSLQSITGLSAGHYHTVNCKFCTHMDVEVYSRAAGVTVPRQSLASVNSTFIALSSCCRLYITAAIPFHVHVVHMCHSTPTDIPYCVCIMKTNASFDYGSWNQLKQPLTVPSLLVVITVSDCMHAVCADQKRPLQQQPFTLTLFASYTAFEFVL